MRCSPVRGQVAVRAFAVRFHWRCMQGVAGWHLLSALLSGGGIVRPTRSSCGRAGRPVRLSEDGARGNRHAQGRAEARSEERVLAALGRLERSPGSTGESRAEERARRYLAKSSRCCATTSGFSRWMFKPAPSMT